MYTVVRGDTAMRIARVHDIPLAALIARNRLEHPERLSVGQRLIIPARASAVAASQGEVASADVDDEPPVIELTPLPSGGDGPLSPSPDVGKAPFIWPADGVVVSLFGRRDGASHGGVDIGVPEGTAVWASAAGEVLYAGQQAGYGNLVIVQHPEDIVTIYAHAKALLVSRGDRVRQGQPIARAGVIGRSSGVHFELRVRRRPVDPLGRLP